MKKAPSLGRRGASSDVRKLSEVLEKRARVIALHGEAVTGHDAIPLQINGAADACGAGTGLRA